MRINALLNKLLIIYIFICNVFCVVLPGCSATGSRKETEIFIHSKEFDSSADETTVLKNGNSGYFEITHDNFDLLYTNGTEVWKSLPVENIDLSKKNVEHDTLFTLNVSSTGGTEYILDSYVDCISRGQYKIESSSEKITIRFTVGDISPRMIFPELISKTTLENVILQNLSEEDGNWLLKRYAHFSLQSSEDTEDNKELLEKFPYLETDDLYSLYSDVSEREKRKLVELSALAGFTEEIMDEEYEKLNFKDKKKKDEPVFELILIFSFDDNDLIVEIPENGINYDTGKYVLNNIELLKNFTFCPTEKINELFFPDGSGAIIEPGKDSIALGRTSKFIYGETYNNIEKIYKNHSQTSIMLPVFGISGKDSSLFAIIEEGEAYGQLVADYIGTTSGIFPSFEYQGKLIESVLDGWQNIRINSYNPHPPSSSFKVRYMLMPSNSSYVEMALKYREYLENKNILTGVSDINIPLYLEILSTVHVDKQMFLFKNTEPEVLTSFEDALNIVNTLKDKGINNIKLKLTGAVNGGMYNSLNNKAKILNILGGKNEFVKFINSLSDYNVDLFLNFDFTHVFKNSLFDGFIPKRDAAKSLNGTFYINSVFNEANASPVLNSKGYCVSPRLFSSMASEMLKSKSYSKISSEKNDGIENSFSISAGTLGEILIPDYTKRYVTDRGESLNEYIKTLDILSDSSEDLMVSGGNSYVFPFTNHILNVPASSSGSLDYSRSVPFIQILMNGHINYAMPFINNQEDIQNALLAALETGSSIHVVMAANDTTLLRQTPLSYYYSVDSNRWLTEIEGMYKKLENVHITEDAHFINHIYITDEFRVTKYSDGAEIYLNYGSETVRYENLTVGAKDFVFISP